MASCAYLGKGKVYLDGRFVGNCSALDMAINENKLQQTNYTSPGGGNCATVSQIDSVELNITMTSYDPDNLALAVFGSTSADASGVVAPESHSAPSVFTEDTLLVTAKLIDTSVAPEVTSDPAGTTYDVGTDYTVSAAGITILASGTIAADDPLLIGYTSQGVNVVQALQTSPAEYNVTFDGLNEADSGAAVVLKCYKVKFGPAADLSFIGDDFAELALTGEVLIDDTITTQGLSKYFTVSLA